MIRRWVGGDPSTVVTADGPVVIRHLLASESESLGRLVSARRFVEGAAGQWQGCGPWSIGRGRDRLAWARAHVPLLPWKSVDSPRLNRCSPGHGAWRSSELRAGYRLCVLRRGTVLSLRSTRLLMFSLTFAVVSWGINPKRLCVSQEVKEVITACELARLQLH